MNNDNWTSSRKRLIAKLLDECELNPHHCVSSKGFRKRNYAEITDVEYLVFQNFILDKNLQYSVNVLCLRHIESSLAAEIRENANSLWRAYRNIYLNSEDDSAFLSTAAGMAGVVLGRAQQALHYMMQTGWHRGYATPADGLFDSVCIGEEVLEFETFTAYVADLYQRQNVTSRLIAPLRASIFPSGVGQDLRVPPLPHSENLPNWVADLPEGVRELAKETFTAKENGWNRLAAMGIRTLFDMVSTEALSVKADSFRKKLDAMVSEEHIAPAQKENLRALVDAGNAAAHRGFNPSAEMVQTMWRIALNALETYFVLRVGADKLLSETPKRT